MTRQIKFTKSGSSLVFGNFGPGDTLRCGEAEARHFVEEAGCAEFVDDLHIAQTSAPKPNAKEKKKAAVPQAQPDAEGDPKDEPNTTSSTETTP